MGWKVSGYSLHSCLAGRMADGKLVNQAQPKEKIHSLFVA
jgi:hypothetical protein